MKNDGLSYRIVRLLIELNNNKINTLDELHHSLALPKATLHRLLLELIQMELVIKHDDTHFYSVTSACTQLSKGVSAQHLYIENAAIIAKQLTEKYEWPVAIATEENNEMLIRFSSRPDARFSFIKSTVGKKFPIMGSALGEIWLAHKSIKTQKKLLSKQSPLTIKRRLKQLKFNDPLLYLEQVKQQGYALRYGKSGESSHLAVPLFKGKVLIAVMGMSVFTTAVGDKIVPLYLEALQEGAKQVNYIT